jgi:hypothetical protein
MTRGKIFKTIQASILAAAIAAVPGFAHAAGVQTGVLTCHEASGWGFVVESTRDLRCVYSPASGPTVHYMGHISKFGVDLGYQGAAVVMWAVFAPTMNVQSGDLSGDYVGATANVALGVGAGANALVGGSNKSISLQPLSIEGATGLNVAAGIGAITLHYQPDAYPASAQQPAAPPPQPQQP